MAFKTAMSVAAVALALVASAGAAAAAPARSAPSMAVATRQAVGGGSPQVVLVPQSAVPSGALGKFKRGDEKKVNVMIDVDIEKEEEKNPEYYGHKKGDEEEVNVKINVDVKKEKEEEEKNGVQLVSGLTTVGAAGLTSVGTPPLVPGGTQELPGQEAQ